LNYNLTYIFILEYSNLNPKVVTTEKAEEIWFFYYY